MTNEEFEIIADQIGPRPGPVRDALRAYWVEGQKQVQAAGNAGVSRPTLSEYVKAWKIALVALARIDWLQIQQDLDNK